MSKPRQRLREAQRSRRFNWRLAPLVVHGNRVQLLENGAQFFPQLLAAIDGARRSLHLETYLIADDKIGQRVLAALTTAAARGVQVRMVIDGFGGGDFARRIVRELAPQGVAVKIFRPERWWRLERKLLRRLHRKLAVIDERVAFVGGINIIDDYNEVPSARGHAQPRFDFAVQCEGPIVAAIALAARRLWWTLELVAAPRPPGPWPRASRTLAPTPVPGGVDATLLLRDNFTHRRTIERAYVQAFESARREIVIANAYFLPGRRFRAALRAARSRGVRVRLLLQGQVEYTIQHHAQRALFGQLLAAGIEIHEYTPSYLHAKVATADDLWATVGSSNIDPYSFLLAREANVVVYDEAFARRLRERIVAAIEEHARTVRAAEFAQRGLLTRAYDWIAYALVQLATVLLARGRNY